MNPIIKELKLFLETSSSEVRKKAWEEVDKYANVGPAVDEFFSVQKTNSLFVKIHEQTNKHN